MSDKILVHGYFIYKCEKCGAVFKMYLEKGLEDKVQDKAHPEKHKPVPFCIGCRKCQKAYAQHVMWGYGDSDDYTELPEGANYFKNAPKEQCGVAVIKKPDAFSMGQFLRENTQFNGRFA